VRVAAQGHVRQVRSGEVLIEAGEQIVPFFVVKAGRQFTGEVNMLSNRRALPGAGGRGARRFSGLPPHVAAPCYRSPLGRGIAAWIDRNPAR
jgi:hypothetical protein